MSWLPSLSTHKLRLDRDFTRFMNDPTFPYKVTVCVGDERVLCSGVLLAQQSSVLERKFREDNGVLMFEELVDVDNSDGGVLECIRYLHGADLEFNIETIGVVLKFTSIYEVEDLLGRSLEWLEGYLSSTKSVRKVMQLLKISSSLNPNHCDRLQSVIRQFIRSNIEIFGTQCADLLELGVAGQDMILIINENPVNSGELLKKWAAMSLGNRSFIAKNHTSFDFTTVYSSSEDFFSFVDVMSDETSSGESIRFLLDLQKSFFESQALPRNTEPSSVNQPQTSQCGRETETRPRTPPSGSKTQPELHHQRSSNSSGGSTARPYNREEIADTTHRSQAVVPSSSNHTTCDIPLEVNICNLPYTASKTKLRKLFSFAGRIQSIEIFPEDDSAVITFHDLEDVLKLILFAMDQDQIFTLDGCELGIRPHYLLQEAFDRCISARAESSAESSGTQLYIGNIPPDADEDRLKRIFCGFGKIIDLKIMVKRGRGNTFGFITFEKVGSAQRLLRRSSQKTYEYDGHELVIDEVRSTRRSL